MRRRLLAWGLAGSVMVTVLGACAALSGLDQYTGDGCTTCTTFSGDTGLSEHQGQEQAPPPSADDGSSDAVDWMTADEGTPPADAVSEPLPYSDVVEGTRDAEAGGPALDAGSDADGGAPFRDAGDGGPPVDAGNHDSAPDAPSCNSASCSGCCTAAGLCAAGGLTSACGTGGAVCQTCSSGNVCSAGSCVPPPPDAGDSGPVGCNAATCSNLCVPYFVQCCKADQSCGCAVFYPRGPCN